MPTIREAAQALAAKLNAPGEVFATIDPARAINNRPCLLVPPPAVDYSEHLTTWRVVALSSHPVGNLAALDELDELLAHAVSVLPVERAEPSGYEITPGGDRIPAYVLTLTT